jgi:hypothetical protein
VAADGTIPQPGSCDWVVSRSGVGIYVVTFMKPYKNIPCGNVTSLLDNVVTLNSVSVNGCVINGYIPSSGVVGDAYFYFIIVGIGLPQ